MNKKKISSNNQNIDVYLNAITAQNKGESVNSQIVYISQEIITLMKQLKKQKKEDSIKSNRENTTVNNSLVLINLLLSWNRPMNYYKSFTDLSEMEKKRVVNELNTIKKKNFE